MQHVSLLLAIASDAEADMHPNHFPAHARTQMDLTKMQLELAAYKEPFMYQHGKACPTSDKELAAALGKKPNPSRVQRC